MIIEHTFLRALPVFLVLSVVVPDLARSEEEQLPSFGEIQQTVEDYFRGTKQHPGDLISKSQVGEALSAVESLGWKSKDQEAILGATLDDQHVLVATLRTPPGKRFMSKISSRELMYDRLDRISTVSGGPQLIRDLVKLPDGERYAKPRSGGGVPDLLDLLPKNASGKTRRIADYHKPTGHLYTVTDLVTRLAESYQKEQAVAQKLETKSKSEIPNR